jgi:DNA-binding NarL/FixJ family response regulator
VKLALAQHIPAMRVLCVARHPFLSEHLGRFFQQLGVDTVPCVGLQAATVQTPYDQIDAVICDYDLLASLSTDVWESHPLLSAVPVIAVSLTRHPGDAHLRDTVGVAGFMYLPTLEPEAARAMLAAVRRPGGIRPSDTRPFLGSSSAAPLR